MQTMNTCKTCRWWGFERESVTQYHETEAKACGFPMVNINEQGYEGVKGNGFGLDYPVCDLITGPDFGCVLHEEKQ